MNENTYKFKTSSIEFSYSLKCNYHVFSKNLLWGIRKCKLKINITMNRIYKSSGLHVVLHIYRNIYIHRYIYSHMYVLHICGSAYIYIWARDIYMQWIYRCIWNTHVFAHTSIRTYIYSLSTLECSWTNDGSFGFCSLAFSIA